MASLPYTRVPNGGNPHFHTDLAHEDRPFIIAEDQRKLRHLESIIIRNIQPSNLNKYGQGKDSLNSQMSEVNTRGTLSRKKNKSSINLKKSTEISSDKEQKNNSLDNAIRTSKEADDIFDPSVKPLETELVLGINDPLERQLKLQELNNRSLIDSFFSLHELFDDRPFYVSEMIERTLNPKFQDFNLVGFGVSQAKFFTLMIWCRPSTSNSEWTLLEKINVKISFLIYAGDDLEEISNAFDNVPNFLIFRMINNSYYILPREGISHEVVMKLAKNHQKYHQIHQPTCSFDQIMKLNNLQVCIHDSLETKNKLALSIENKLKEIPYLEVERRAVMDRLDNLQKLKGEKEALLSSQIKKVQELKIDILKRENELQKVKQLLKTERFNDKKLLEEKLHANLEGIRSTESQISFEKSRICRALMDIFKIEPISDRPYNFQLFGLRFPTRSRTRIQDNTNGTASIHSLQSQESSNTSGPLMNVNLQSLTRTQEIEIAALLGFIAQLVVILSYYLSIPLRYPVEPFGCHSYVIDPISKIKSSRMFPLWVKENAIFRFEYALLLLGKNIEQLMESQGLKSVDRNFLGNLHILLICLSSTEVGFSKELGNKKESELIESHVKYNKKETQNQSSPPPQLYPDHNTKIVALSKKREFSEPTTTTTTNITGSITTDISNTQNNYSEEERNDLIKNRDRINIIKRKLSSLNIQRA